MLNKVRPYMMPVAMLAGIIFYPFFSEFAFLTPYLLFVMLFLTYFNLSLKSIHITKLHVYLLIIQVVGSISIYFLLNLFNFLVAQAAMICVLAPTATSAPVIARILKGNVESLITYSLLCNMTVAIVAPIFFSWIGTQSELSFFESFLNIGKQVAGILIAPLVLALICRKIVRNTFSKAALFSNVSFILWTVALIIVTAKIVNFILIQDSKDFVIECAIAGCSLIICILQFLTGRKIGRKFNDTIAGGQGLGQKNTILAIWMAQTYLNPISSLGPGVYVLWQNIVNSYQVWRQKDNVPI